MAAALALAATVAFSEQEAIPGWVKSTAGWWADGSIGDTDYIHRDSYYSMEQPGGWERQIHIKDPAARSVRDSIVVTETIDKPVPAIISVQAYPITGANMTEHREWGLELVKEYLGDAFVHTSAVEATVAGNPGYIDEYEIAIFGIDILGKAYSFEHQGDVYEIKYEADIRYFQEYLPEFERIVQTFQLAE